MKAATRRQRFGIVEQTENFEREIDRLVCQLYGLTVDEIATVGGAAKSV